VNITIFSDMEPEDTETFDAFVLAHGMSHEQIYDALLTNNIVVNHFPYFDATFWDKDWLLFHQQEHEAIYTAIGLTGMPDLASSDLKNDGELKTWMDVHRQVHENINLILNL